MQMIITGNQFEVNMKSCPHCGSPVEFKIAHNRIAFYCEKCLTNLTYYGDKRGLCQDITLDDIDKAFEVWNSREEDGLIEG